MVRALVAAIDQTQARFASETGRPSHSSSSTSSIQPASASTRTRVFPVGSGASVGRTQDSGRNAIGGTPTVCFYIGGPGENSNRILH